jgi:hypothetical protein
MTKTNCDGSPGSISVFITNDTLRSPSLQKEKVTVTEIRRDMNFSFLLCIDDIKFTLLLRFPIFLLSEAQPKNALVNPLPLKNWNDSYQSKNDCIRLFCVEKQSYWSIRFIHNFAFHLQFSSSAQPQSKCLLLLVFQIAVLLLIKPSVFIERVLCLFFLFAIYRLPANGYQQGKGRRLAKVKYDNAWNSIRNMFKSFQANNEQ